MSAPAPLVRSLASLVPAPLAGWLTARAFTFTMRPRASARSRSILAEARRFRVSAPHPVVGYAWGEQDEPTVVLVHGWHGRAAQMTGFVAPLRALGYRVVAYDAPAHGASPGRFTTAVDMAEGLLAVVDAVGEVEAVVAHSLGGKITGIAARRGLGLDRLALVAPAPSARPFAKALADRLGLSSAQRREADDAILTRARVADWDELDLGPAIPHLPTPLVLHDERDRFVPLAATEALVEQWPGATLVRTNGLGHTRILDDDSVVARVVAHLGHTVELRAAG